MVSRAFNVETAAFEVGYESPSQFSREYARMFGAPPKRDLKHLQALFRAGRVHQNGEAIPRDRDDRSKSGSLSWADMACNDLV